MALGVIDHSKKREADNLREPSDVQREGTERAMAFLIVFQ